MSGCDWALENMPHGVRRRPQSANRGCKAASSVGFSLLEVILALAILTGAIAVLGEIARSALRNAQAARDITRAQLLCEGILNEIAAGLIPCDPVLDAPCAQLFDERDRGWLYSIENMALDEDGLIAVQVTVRQDLPATHQPVQVTLVRWMMLSDL
jgi:general secretion pathway protein I